MRQRISGLAGPLPFLAMIISLGGCVDEEIVYRDRQLFVDPPAGAVGMLGYSDEESKLTVCGNCHVDFQSQWEETAHANAWESLQSSGHAQSTCEGCHTVAELGNELDQSAGWTATNDTRYYDVQCESCHGPGLGHVQSPDGTQPLASMQVGLDLTVGCGECHNGTHHPYVEEWQESAHGQMSHSASPASRGASCDYCHAGEAALQAWGVKADYKEKAQLVASASEFMPITCAVCHDPHANDEEGQLRFPIDVPNEEENLCMKCHHKRGEVDPTTFRGPHSPEGPVVLGYGGWWPPSMTFEGGEIVATHGSDRNPKLCAGCHVNSFEATDAATGTAYHSVGHNFDPIPCVDAGGKPTGEHDCQISARSFKSCAVAGCHPSEQSARGAMTAELLLEQNLADQINALLNQVQPNWRTCYLTGSGSCGANSPLNIPDGKYTTAEGAAFNWQLATSTPASAIHNPFLVRALLASTIIQLRQDYNLPLPPGLSEAKLSELMRSGK